MQLNIWRKTKPWQFINLEFWVGVDRKLRKTPSKLWLTQSGRKDVSLVGDFCDCRPSTGFPYSKEEAAKAEEEEASIAA